MALIKSIQNTASYWQ